MTLCQKNPVYLKHLKTIDNDLLKYAEPYYYKTSKAKKERFYYLLKKDAESKSQLIPTPNSLRNAEAEQRLFYLPPVEVKDD